MGTPDEGQWQPTPSQAEGERDGADETQWKPIPEQPAEGDPEVVEGDDGSASSD